MEVPIRIITSKTKARIVKWAKTIGYEIVWLDDRGFWHAAKNLNNTPFLAEEAEYVATDMTALVDLQALSAQVGFRHDLFKMSPEDEAYQAINRLKRFKEVPNGK